MGDWVDVWFLELSDSGNTMILCWCTGYHCTNNDNHDYSEGRSAPQWDVVIFSAVENPAAECVLRSDL